MLPGAHRVSFEKAGAWRIYWRASRDRGALTFWSCSKPTREEAEEFERHHAPAVAERYALAAHPRPAAGFIAKLIVDFKGSPDWAGLAPRTKAEWARHLDRIRDVFGATSFAAIERRGSRKLIKAWHQGMSATPRTANAALSVLVRLFNFGVDQEDLTRNPAEKIARIDEGASRTAIVWSPAEFDKLLECRHTGLSGRKGEGSGAMVLGPARKRALQLAWLTGLRREDLIRLRWDEVDLDAGMIRRPTLKSRGRHVARINIDPELRALLLEMKPAEDATVKSLTVVATEAGKPYASPDAFSSSVRTAFDTAKICAPDGRRKHLHDMRGTRATLMYAQGCSDADMEVWFAWAPGQAADMRAVYGDPETIAVAAGKKVRGVG
jgi:integrase